MDAVSAPVEPDVVVVAPETSVEASEPAGAVVPDDVVSIGASSFDVQLVPQMKLETKRTSGLIGTCPTHSRKRSAAITNALSVQENTVLRGADEARTRPYRVRDGE